MKISLLCAGRALTSVLFCLSSCVGHVSAAPGSPFTLVSETPRTLMPSTLSAARTTQTPGLPSPGGKALAFGQKSVRLVMVTGPEDDMLSYRIGGLRNPTLVVPRGATLRILFVNTDDDMAHNIRFGATQKIYPNVMTAYAASSIGTPELPHKSDTALHAEELTLRVPPVPGTYAYLCTVRGHAQGGMVGKVIVR